MYCCGDVEGWIRWIRSIGYASFRQIMHVTSPSPPTTLVSRISFLPLATWIPRFADFPLFLPLVELQRLIRVIFFIPFFPPFSVLSLFIESRVDFLPYTPREKERERERERERGCLLSALCTRCAPFEYTLRLSPGIFFLLFFFFFFLFCFLLFVDFNCIISWWSFHFPLEVYIIFFKLCAFNLRFSRWLLRVVFPTGFFFLSFFLLLRARFGGDTRAALFCPLFFHVLLNPFVALCYFCSPFFSKVFRRALQSRFVALLNYRGLFFYLERCTWHSFQSLFIDKKD